MNESKQWTVAELLQAYPTLGLPHFQRGHVWTSSSVSLLLESLYYDTPCGSIILWKPREPEREGIALPGADKITHLLIDGQQRVRSIHDALADFCSGTDGEEEGAVVSDDAGRPRVWCLNLARLREFSSLIENEHLVARPLFVKVVDPRLTQNMRFKRDLLPLEVLLDLRAEDGPIEWELLSGNSAEILAKASEIGLRERVRRMLDRTFFVVIKEETESENSLADMVHLYNRINSGGMQVQAEERGFATLVSINSGANAWLQDLFCRVHDVDQDEGGLRLLRDDVLRRTQERSFGFKLFMRAFTQSASHHFGRSIGSSALSFGVIDGWWFQERLQNHTDPAVCTLFDRCTRMILDVCDVLRKDLYCDSFPFLPETTSLVAVFQLLLRYPDLLHDADSPDGSRQRSLVAFIILKLMLAGYDQREVFQIAGAISATHCLEQCFDIIKGISLPDLEERLEYANSLSNRRVLMLYWLLRKRGARDFLYEQLSPGPEAPLQPGQEVLIDSAVHPEKQHVVPYSLLTGPYGITGRGRISSHVVNNIGNLTYISNRLNHFDTGLGANPLQLELERGKNMRNLEAHFLADHRALEKYSCLLDLVERREQTGDTADETIRKRFEEFCALRRQAIASGFHAWVDELESASKFSEATAVRTEPAPRLFWRSVSDHIRALEYDNHIEDELHRLHDAGLVKPRWVAGRDSEDRRLASLHIAVRKPEKRQRLMDLTLEVERMTLRLRRPSHPVSLLVMQKGILLQRQDPAAVGAMPPGHITLASHTGGSEATCELLRELHTLAAGEKSLAGAEAIRESLGPLLLEKRKRSGARTGGRKPNLTWREMRSLAQQAGVEELYDAALRKLKPLVDGVNRTRQNVTFVGRFEGGRSRWALFGIYPAASDPAQGLAVMIYTKEMTRYIGISEQQLLEALGVPASTAGTWKPDATWHMDAGKIDAFVRLMAGRKP
jgi:hypothetical protein